LQAEGKAKQGKARWIGYDKKGNGLVKQDSEIRTVRVIGNISLKAGSSVYIDEENTIEIKKKRKAAEKPKFQKNISPKPKEQLIYRPLVYVPDPDLIGDYLLIYREPFTATNDASAFEELELANNQSSSGGRVLWQTENQYNPRNADMLMITAGVVDVGGVNISGSTPAFATLNFGSSTANVSGAGPVYNLPADYIANVETGQTLSFTMSMASPSSGGSFAYFGAHGRMFSYRNSPVYYVTGANKDYTIDFSNYISTGSRVVDSVLLHSYISSPGGSSRYLYNIFAVASIDNLSVTEDPSNVYNSTTSTSQNYFYACPLTYQYIFTKINLRTGTTEGSSIETTLFDNLQSGAYSLDYLYSISIGRNLDFVPPVATSGSVFNQNWSNYLDPRPLFQNADPGDWIYQVKDAINDFPDTTGAWTTVRSFLQKSYRNGKLNNYFTDGLLQYSSGVVFYPTAREKTIDLTSITNFSSIQNAFSGATALGSLDSVIETGEWIDHVTSVSNTSWARYFGPNLQTSLPQYALATGVSQETIDKTTAFALNLGPTEYIYLDR